MASFRRWRGDHAFACLFTHGTPDTLDQKPFHDPGQVAPVAALNAPGGGWRASILNATEGAGRILTASVNGAQVAGRV